MSQETRQKAVCHHGLLFQSNSKFLSWAPTLTSFNAVCNLEVEAKETLPLLLLVEYVISTTKTELGHSGRTKIHDPSFFCLTSAEITGFSRLHLDHWDNFKIIDYAITKLHMVFINHLLSFSCKTGTILSIRDMIWVSWSQSKAISESRCIGNSIYLLLNSNYIVWLGNFVDPKNKTCISVKLRMMQGIVIHKNIL